MNHFEPTILKAKKEISHLFSLFFLRRYFPEKTSTIIVSNLHKFFWVLSGIVDFFVTILMKLLNTNPQFSLQLCLFLYIGLINYADRSYVVPLQQPIRKFMVLFTIEITPLKCLKMPFRTELHLWMNFTTNLFLKKNV